MRAGVDIIILLILRVNFDDIIFDIFHSTNNVPPSFSISCDMLKLLEKGQ